MPFELTKLPYGVDELMPWMSKETIEFHHGKHHQGYITALNALIKGTKFADLSLKEVVLQSEGKLFNNAAQAWNHDFFWHCLKPQSKSFGESKENVSVAITRCFGSVDRFKREFNDEVQSLFGSGWVWLVDKGIGNLSIVSLTNAGNPMTSNWKPVLVCDVWEHAYYIDYRNDRSKFMEAYWHLIDWDFVEMQLRVQ